MTALSISNIQRLVAEAVAERGYRDGWTSEQFIARQIAKIVEEAAELAQTTRRTDAEFTPHWIADADYAGYSARQAFDDVRWDGMTTDVEKAKKELADVMVVALTLAEELKFDVLRAALYKSLADVERGVRGNGKGT